MRKPLSLQVRIIIGLAIALVVLLIIGNATSQQENLYNEPSPVPTVTVTDDPDVVTPQSETYGSDTPDAPLVDPTDQQQAMALTWDYMPADQQETLCRGWNTPNIQDLLLDSYLKGAPSFNREIVRDFFNTHC